MRLDNDIRRGSPITEYSKYNHNTINANDIKWSTTISGFTLMKKLPPGYDKVHNYVGMVTIMGFLKHYNVHYHIYISREMKRTKYHDLLNLRY